MSATPAKQSSAPQAAAKTQAAQVAGPVLTPFALLGQRLGNSALHRVLQAKLTVSDPRDPFEQEADRVADQVMRMPDTQTLARSPLKIQRVCDQCAEELHRSEEAATAAPTVDATTENAIASLSGRGGALAESTRTFMESRFQADFGNVRIHNDAHAHDLARSVQAKAFTVGNNVVFGAGHYSPDSSDGKRLLAHELTHVVQQGGAHRTLQRQPVDPPPPPAPPPAPAPTATPFDPDKSEQDMRDQPDTAPLPKVDQQNQIADVNDAAARELVKLIFGDDDVNASVGDLSNAVQDDMDSDVGAGKAAEKKAGGLTADQIEARTQNRIRFLKRLRLYFNSWNDMLEHFREIEQFSSSDGPMEVLLHHSAMEHFKRALATLKAKGHPMPRIMSGFQLRKAYQHEAEQGGPDSAGMMVHALGYAFDAFVKGNPRITYSNSHTKGPERHVFDLLSVVVGADKTAMNLNVAGRDNQTFIAAMGARTLTDDKSATEDTDAKAMEYFKVFEQQFNRMLAGSKEFTQSISTTHRDALLKLRTDYFAELDAIDAERRKPKPDAAVIAAHRQKRHDLLAAMPSHMAEWVAKLDKEDVEVRDKNKKLGMDHLRSPTVVRTDQQKNAKDVASANQKLHAAQAAAAKAHTAFQNAEAAIREAKRRKSDAQRALRAAQAAPRSGGSGGDWQPVDPRVESASKALVAAEAAVVNSEQAANAAWKSVGEFRTAVDVASDELKSFESQRTALGTELKGSLGAGLGDKDRSDLMKAWGWIDRLKELRQWLATPDLDSQSGLATFERLMVGDRSERDTKDRVNIADNPPLLRLLDIGYFNPTGAFDLAFFEEMAHHGFVPGASWNPDSVDSMHFQFVAGRNAILEPGKRK